jgi:hypothetical protein
MRIILLSSLLLLGLIGTGLSNSAVLAQDSPLAEEQKAVFVFDIRMDKISNGELGKMLDLESKMEGLPGPSGDAPPPSAIERVFGAVSAPETIRFKIWKTAMALCRWSFLLQSSSMTLK